MTTVLAYLDPGSGSMILQIIAGGLAAVAVTAKLYWGRILTFLRIRKDRGRRPTSSRAATPQRSAQGPRQRLPPGIGARPCPARNRFRRARAGSFRDPESRVFYAGDEVFRALSADGPERLRGARGERPAPTTSASSRPSARRHARHSAACSRTSRAAVLRHERIPFVSYPYEWTFSMLKDAALAAARPAARGAREGPRPEGLVAVQRPVQGRASRCSWTSAPSSACARASRGSATASSACSTSTRCCCRR